LGVVFGVGFGVARGLGVTRAVLGVVVRIGWGGTVEVRVAGPGRVVVVVAVTELVDEADPPDVVVAAGSSEDPAHPARTTAVAAARAPPRSRTASANAAVDRAATRVDG
jgi:hypothetical protein